MAFLNTAIILCSRASSKRLPGKCFLKLNQKPILEHLIDRLMPSKIPIILAVPKNEEYLYKHLEAKGVTLFTGYEHDPMARMFHAARIYKVKTIIRVTHDKVFVDYKTLLKAVYDYNSGSHDYLYSTKFTDGSAFEIIDFELIKKAALLYNDVEFISYAVKNLTKNKLHFYVPKELRSDHRLLIDYEDDLKLLEIIFNKLGNDVSLKDTIRFLDKSRWVNKINRMPLLTVYTCSYNSSDYIEKCIHSILNQNIFYKTQYIFIDDCSTDDSYYKACKLTYKYNNVKIVRNQENVGLSSSSNVALKHAKGRYIVRLDADDYFINTKSLDTLMQKIITEDCDVVYPDNYFGSYQKTQKGNEQHHVGGAIFKTRAINHIKFTERLTGLEGYDWFLKAKKELDIGYLDEPMFFYRQHDKSLSKNNLEQRQILKQQIESAHL